MALQALGLGHADGGQKPPPHAAGGNAAIQAPQREDAGSNEALRRCRVEPADHQVCGAWRLGRQAFEPAQQRQLAQVLAARGFAVQRIGFLVQRER